MSGSSLSIVFSLAVGPITLIGGGKLRKKVGTSVLIIVGGIWFGLGMIISGFSNSKIMLMGDLAYPVD